MRGTFRSLGIYNYRLWAGGGLISNVGTWMQRTAQDWLVLAELTHHKAGAVGVVMGLQFGPQLLMLPFSGTAADRLDRRKLLIVTQCIMGLLALGLGVLTVTGAVRLWEVYLFAFLLGCVAAFDSPARQTFVSALVPEAYLPNAVALNSTSFNAGRLIGPAVAGILISAVGTGAVFILNGLSFAAPVASLLMLRREEFSEDERPARNQSGFLEGLRYVRGRPDLMAILTMLALIGTFGLNFPIFISTMAVSAFHVGSSGFGLLSSVLALGAVAGGLIAAQRERPRLRFLIAGALSFGIFAGVAALMPTFALFALALVPLGIAAQTFNTSTNGILQMSTEPAMRGRVMALFIAIFAGGTPIGAPMVGWIADHAGPRWSLAMAAAAGIAATLVGLAHVRRTRAAARQKRA